jgi:uncharacterized protein (DUF362 family)
MKRRDFLRWQLAGAAWLAGSSLQGPAGLLAAPRPDVAVVRGDAARAARQAVRMLGGMGSVVASGDTVVIKPNMSFPDPPGRATNTNPQVVRALAGLCLDAGAAAVFVLDHPLSTPEQCLKQAGIQDACRDLDKVHVHTMASRRFYQEANIPDGEDMRSNLVARQVLEADKLIAAPVAKTHSATGVSLSLKGMMGLVYDRWAMHSRHDLDAAIVDLATLLWADLAVVDATRVLATNGPFGPGEVLDENTIIASRNMLEADAVTVSLFPWYGRSFRPDQVPHLKLAGERGLGRVDVDQINVAEKRLQG